MYLSEKTIRRFLCKCDEIFENIPMYVSSTYGKKKTSNCLYKLVHEVEKVNYSKWLHTGDNIKSDIKSSIGQNNQTI